MTRTTTWNTVRRARHADASLLPIKRLKNGSMKIHDGFPHGMRTTHAEVINPDLLAVAAG